jgi:hypothetical protein
MLHQISGDGFHFGVPRLLGEGMRSIISWSRLFADQEVLVAINTDQEQALTAYSTVTPLFRAVGDRFRLVFWEAPVSSAPPAHLVVERKGELLAVRPTIPPAGFVIYIAAPGLTHGDLRPDAFPFISPTR